MNRFPFLLAAAMSLVAPALSFARGSEAMPDRAAIVVGATAPVPGRAILRHAYHDADAIADVLVSVGGFARSRVHVLRDPDPEALVAALEREASALAGVSRGMLFFYYSGHADERALYTAGKPVAIESLRHALERPDVSLRIGIIDACRGGSWTRAKGLVPEAPFEVAVPPALASEGSALIASSSGAESAHESDAIAGSFFTHHFAAALRGAADEGRKGEVTLGQAFEYARQQTIRDTARHARDPQHPSFALNLKGRQDVVLARVETSPSTLALDQAEGPLEVIHLGSGMRMLELPPGSRRVTLAVPPGQYLVRRIRTEGVQAREVSVPLEGVASVREEELLLVGAARLAMKDAGRYDVVPPLPERGGGEVEFGIATWRDFELGYPGIGTGDQVGAGSTIRFDARLGITDRLIWKVGTLAFAYRLGERGGVEVVPYGGVVSWKLPLGGDTRTLDPGAFYRGDAEMRVGAGVGVRWPFTGGAVVLTGSAERIWIGGQQGARYHGGAGLTFGIGGSATVHLSAGMIWTELPTIVVEQYDPVSGYLTIRGVNGYGPSLFFGSLQEFGLASLPLLRLGPWRGFSFDLYAAGIEYRRASYRFGLTRSF